MKKISKILSRRLGRGAPGGGDDGGHWEAAPLESAPDFHQLTPRRETSGGGGGGDAFRGRVPRTGTSRILADGSEGANGPCAVCARIDFARLLAWRPGDARPWISLSHALKLAHEKTDDAAGLCPWCVFFYCMISAAPDGDGKEDAEAKKKRETGKFTPYLRIRLAFERLGGGEKHELGRSVLFEVTTRNRSLPWGYIVKAAPAPEVEENGDAGLAGYLGGNGGQGGNAATTVIQGRTVPPLLTPELPKCWIDFCKEHHATGPCAVKAKSSIQGLKLIDCEDRRVVSAEHLESAADGEHQNGHAIEYVTLSYVWGNASDIEDQASGQETDGSGDLPEQLPALIADAVTITKALGFRYLWVDRYCIPGRHDAAVASDRQRQLNLMGQIYRLSALTLIVAAGEGVHDGIPGISTLREQQLSLRTETGLFTTSLLRPDLDITSSKWASRAWTYQEGLLSRRRLVFTPSQIYFQCQTLHCHESISLPLHLAPGLNLGRVFPSASEALQPGKLKNHIKSYMGKTLTHDDERLDAFAGILHEYSQQGNLAVQHFLGLPLFHPNDFTNVKVVSQTDRLAVALGWMPGRTVSSSSSQGDLGSLVVDPYCLLDAPCPFPSWTWLAWRPQQAGQDYYKTLNYAFNFNLVGEASPLVDGVCAAPRMEASIGFGDGMVLSWEIDGDAIARKAERIAFLRLKTFCFDLLVKKAAGAATLTLAEPTAATLGQAAADAIEAWIRRSSVAVVSATSPAADEDDDAAAADQQYQLTGVLVSGRNWKSGGSQPGGGGSATALVCGRRNWEHDGAWVRLGALSIAHEGLVAAAGEGEASVLKSVDSGASEKKDMGVQLRELDIY